MEKITLGQAIDNMVKALEGLDDSNRKIAINAVSERFNIGQNELRADRLEEAIIKTKATDIRTFKNEKKPSSAIEMACIIAYYLQEIAPETDKKDFITKSEIEKYFKQGGFKLPKNTGQLLVDTKAAGYFDLIKAGQYKLNAVGYNLVVHTLPKAK